uniref:Uncharacterized protein n=1 Tax=Romanomermis culicivorax TaxID=13658 RepID=A0A915KLS9_ROMCU
MLHLILTVIFDISSLKIFSTLGAGNRVMPSDDKNEENTSLSIGTNFGTIENESSEYRNVMKTIKD